MHYACVYVAIVCRPRSVLLPPHDIAHLNAAFRKPLRRCINCRPF